MSANDLEHVCGDVAIANTHELRNSGVGENTQDEIDSIQFILLLSIYTDI